MHGFQTQPKRNTVSFGNGYIVDAKMVSRWCNGLARLQHWPFYLQAPGFVSQLLPVEFFSCNKVSPLNDQTTTSRSVPCAAIN